MPVHRGAAVDQLERSQAAELPSRIMARLLDWAVDPEVETLCKADRSRPDVARLCVLQLGVNAGAAGMES